MKRLLRRLRDEFRWWLGYGYEQKLPMQTAIEHGRDMVVWCRESLPKRHRVVRGEPEVLRRHPQALDVPRPVFQFRNEGDLMMFRLMWSEHLIPAERAERAEIARMASIAGHVLAGRANARDFLSGKSAPRNSWRGTGK